MSTINQSAPSNQLYRLYSYADVNDVYCTNYSDRKFTDFEIKIFNLDIDPDFIEINLLSDCDKLYSLCAFYEVHEKYDKTIKIIHRMLSLGDTRAYLKLGVYLLDYKNDKEKAYEIFKIGASKGNINCIKNVGLYYQDNKNYTEAIKYFTEALKQNEYDVCVNIFYCYAQLKNISMGYKFLKLGIKNNNKNAFDCFCAGFGNDDLYHVLLKFDFINELIQNKINELRPNIINEQYCQNLYICSDTHELFDSNFDILLSSEENETFCKICGLEGYIDIFEFLDDLSKDN